ncbi:MULTISPECIES: DUF3742 family protein [Alcaligenaceae]|uniref:Transposon n=1 Tax=Bordetella petrii (strain ATCC BAA-461 / DSM 12804 / CCUG 43448 / CIP 107267 / Se-1111R) TaxID=340100 RepID=A9IBE3_BORPD|nr:MULTISPECIES: DUF3742 family protein [Alcaligenaceae]CAP41421.1 conserved hypothetical protein [Bordetella petrii]CUJ46621.1 Protein of uncharacterised function (DUF3742) [Achromobacter xylosoxidans]CUJ71021.1 Protein of uncharacterised function (DUF3742) [Achromobacter xylosoxidans]
MNTTTRIRTAERLGRTFGRGWRAYARGERWASNWLVSKGVPAAGATVLVWAVKLAVLGVLLYVASWLALLVVFLVFVAHGYDTDDLATPEPEWRDGHLGFGLYTVDEHRIDPHDPNDPQNT